MPEHCRPRLFVVVVLAIALGLSAIPAHAQGIFGPTFSTTSPGIFGPVPTLDEYMPCASCGDSVLSGEGDGPFGETPDVTSDGFGSTFSTTSPGIFGPVPTLDEYWPRASAQ